MDVREKVTNRKRLIDADKLLTNAVTISNSEGQATWSAVSTIDILAAPIVDAVEIVRCKDCKYCDISLVLPTGRKMYNCMEGSHDHKTLLKSNDFCNRGERRKEYE